MHGSERRIALMDPEYPIPQTTNHEAFDCSYWTSDG